MTRYEQSKDLLFDNLDGLCNTGRISEQERDALKVYAIWMAEDARAEAMEVKELPTAKPCENEMPGKYVPLAHQLGGAR